MTLSRIPPSNQLFDKEFIQVAGPDGIQTGFQYDLETKTLFAKESQIIIPSHHGITHVSSDPVPNATTDTPGLLSQDDKAKLDALTGTRLGVLGFAGAGFPDDGGFLQGDILLAAGSEFISIERIGNVIRLTVDIPQQFCACESCAQIFWVQDESDISSIRPPSCSGKLPGVNAYGEMKIYLLPESTLFNPANPIATLGQKINFPAMLFKRYPNAITPGLAEFDVILQRNPDNTSNVGWSFTPGSKGVPQCAWFMGKDNDGGQIRFDLLPNIEPNLLGALLYKGHTLTRQMGVITGYSTDVVATNVYNVTFWDVLGGQPVGDVFQATNVWRYNNPLNSPTDLSDPRELVVDGTKDLLPVGTLVQLWEFQIGTINGDRQVRRFFNSDPGLTSGVLWSLADAIRFGDLLEGRVEVAQGTTGERNACEGNLSDIRVPERSQWGITGFEDPLLLADDGRGTDPLEVNLGSACVGDFSGNSPSFLQPNGTIELADCDADPTGSGFVPPTPAGPPAVTMGTAADFAAFAYSGISNATFPAAITGDMGISPATDAAITGFALVLDGSGQFSTSTQVIGKVYAPNYSAPTPAKVLTAQNDVLTAYNDAIGRPVDFLNFNSGVLDGQTLTPGVYKWTTGVTLGAGQTVTLNGGPGDTFILISTGVISTGAASNVILAGGVQAGNIWWAPISMAIGANATVNGVILSSTTISMGSMAILNGRALAQTAITIDQSTITQSIVVPPAPPTPPDADIDLIASNAFFHKFIKFTTGSLTGQVFEILHATTSGGPFGTITIYGDLTGVGFGDAFTVFGESNNGQPSGIAINNQFVADDDPTLPGLRVVQTDPMSISERPVYLWNRRNHGNFMVRALVGMPEASQNLFPPIDILLRAPGDSHDDVYVKVIKRGQFLAGPFSGKFYVVVKGPQWRDMPQRGCLRTLTGLTRNENWRFNTKIGFAPQDDDGIILVSQDNTMYLYDDDFGVGSGSGPAAPVTIPSSTTVAQLIHEDVTSQALRLQFSVNNQTTAESVQLQFRAGELSMCQPYELDISSGAIDDLVRGFTPGKFTVSQNYIQQGFITSIENPPVSVPGFKVYTGGFLPTPIDGQTERFNELILMCRNNQLWVWWNRLLITPDPILNAALPTPVAINAPFFPINSAQPIGKVVFRLWPGATMRQVEIRDQLTNFNEFTFGQLKLTS